MQRGKKKNSSFSLLGAKPINYVHSSPSLELKKKLINLYQDLKKAQFIKTITFWDLNILQNMNKQPKHIKTLWIFEAQALIAPRL